MEFGLFYQLPCADEQSPADRYADTVSQAQLADKLGFDTVWLAEVHFNPRFSVLPAPLLLGLSYCPNHHQPENCHCCQPDAPAPPG